MEEHLKLEDGCQTSRMVSDRRQRKRLKELDEGKPAGLFNNGRSFFCLQDLKGAAHHLRRAPTLPIQETCAGE